MSSTPNNCANGISSGPGSDRGPSIRSQVDCLNPPPVPPGVQKPAWPLLAQGVGFSFVFADQVWVGTGQVCMVPESNARVSLKVTNLWCSGHRVSVTKALGSLPAHLPRSVMVAESYVVHRAPGGFSSSLRLDQGTMYLINLLSVPKESIMDSHMLGSVTTEYLC